MFTHLVVPLDGSARAEQALPVAARIARASGSRLSLLRVVPTIPPLGLAYGGPTVRALMAKEETDEVSDYLSALREGALFSGIAVDTHVAAGDPAAAILDYAQSCAADLIVLCSHGRTGATRWMLGSVAQHIARQSTVPVLILHIHGPMPAHPHPDPEVPLRVLVPLDGSPLAEAALRPAADLALALGGSHQAALHLTTALSPYDIDPTHVPDAFALDGARAYLRQTADRISGDYPNLSVAWSVTAASDFAEALLRVAEMGEDVAGASSPTRCDLIAMATHGMSGIVRWTLGSVTERVLHHTRLPLLIVRPATVAGLPRPGAHAAIQGHDQPGAST